MSGWIKLHRKILDSPLWKDCNNNQRLLMITLLLKANHETKKWIFKGQEYEVGPGQFITSLKSLSEDTGLTMSSVQRSLLKLEKYNFSISKSTNKNRLITIVNWEKYQSIEDEPISKTIGDRKATDKQPITNKNIRNKEYKNNNIYNVIDDYLQNKSNSFRVAFKEFLQMKKSMKNEVKTEYQFNLLVNKLERLSTVEHKQVELINIAIEKGWKSFYPIPVTKADKDNSNFNKFSQRNYDMDDLENKLLGWEKNK